MILIQQVIINKSALHTIKIDACTSAGPVFVDDVSIDFGIGADPITSLAGVGIDLDSTSMIVMTGIEADDRAIAAVRYIDSVLIDRIGAHIIFEQEIIREAGEDATLLTIVAKRITYNTMIR
jgi:hypothetical protein